MSTPEVQTKKGWVPYYRPDGSGGWVCVCNKKRNTLRSIQRHVKMKHPFSPDPFFDPLRKNAKAAS